MNIRPVFSDPQLQATFQAQGYVVVPALDTSTMQALIDGYDSLVDPQPMPFESTMNSPSSQHKRQVHELVCRHLTATAQQYLNNYKPVVGNFVRKQASEESVVPAHQDWTMCDETQFSAVNIWIPMVDVSEHNGAIYILKGGQHFPFTIRGNFIPPAFDYNLYKDYRRLTPIFMKAGEALIYDLRCVHTSPPNRSLSTRLAAGMACIPQEATPLHYYFDQANNSLDCYEADIEFYVNYAYGVNQIPATAKRLSQQKDFTPTSIPLNIQEQLLEQQHPQAMIFKNPQHQAQYERDGYILIDALSNAESAELLKTFEQITPWFKEGFMSSIYAPQEGYKEQVDALLEPYGKRLIEQYMIDYEVIVSTFMVKGSGEYSAMYPHQDWTLVDESRFATFNIWIPLIDIDERNGAMSIMRGGHKLPFTMRGSCVPDALTDKSAFMPDKLTYMPMKAGQALIYDHRCIHVSPPNRSGKVRPACAISIAPKQVEVFHYFYHKDSNLLQRYKADKSFYFNHVATQFEPPKNAILIDEQQAAPFYAFTNEELSPVFAQQSPRKKGFWERLFGK